MIKDIFYSDKYDDRIAVIDGENSYSIKNLKEIIYAQTEFLKNKSDNIIIFGDDSFNFIIQFFASVFSDKNIFLISDKKNLENFEHDYYVANNLTDKRSTTYNFPQIDLYKERVHFYTSGSTGYPKTIIKNIFNLTKEAADVAKELGLYNKSCIVGSTTTMCHLFGLTMYFFVPFCSGLKIDTQRIFYSEQVDKKDFVLITTPTFLNAISKHNLSFPVNPQYVFSAGGVLSDMAFEYFNDKTNLIDIYGSSETGVIAHRTEAKSLFKTFKNVKIQAGENNIKVISDYCYEGEYILNDKIEIKEGGFVFKDRTDRMMKIYDKRVSAPALENRIKENEFVDDCYVFKAGEKPVCICALSDKGKGFIIKNSPLNLTKIIKNFTAEKFEIIPQKWKYIDEIPRTNSGKINRKIIEKIFNINSSLPVIFDRKIIPNGIIYKIFFYKNCNFFKGHFPEYNLVPGVVQLSLAKEVANARFELNLGQGQWKRIKFSNIIESDKVINLKLEKDEKKVSYEYYDDERKYSSGVFLCKNIFRS